MSTKIPPEWSRVRLGDLGRTINGLTGKSADDFSDGEYFITYLQVMRDRPNDLLRSGKVRVSSEERQNRLQYGDLLFTGSSETAEEVGLSAVYLNRDHSPFLNSFCFGLRQHSNNLLDPNYARFYLRGNSFRASVVRLAQGSTRYNLSKTEFLKLVVTLPPLAEQKKIAEILSSVDEVIENTESEISKLEDLKKATLNELLTKGIGHTEFKDSEIGRIPKSWTVRSLREVTLKIADRDHTTPKYVEDRLGVPIVSPKDLTEDMEIDRSNLKFISSDAHQINRRKTDLAPNDIIFSRIGAGLGKSVLLEKDFFDFSILHSLCQIRPDPSRVRPKYLLWQLRCADFQERMKIGIQSIGVPDLGLKEISHLKILVAASHAEQESLVEIIDSIAQTKSDLVRSLFKWKLIRGAVLSDLLTGKVRVKVN